MHSFVTKIQHWNRETFGNIFRRKKSLLTRINGVQRNRRYGYNTALDKIDFHLQKEYNETLKQEEIF